jgi:hypothetical protein
MDLLADQLNDYSRHGIPRLPHLLTFEADEDTEEALYRYRARIMLALVDWSGLCRWVKFLLIRGPSRLFFCATLQFGGRLETDRDGLDFAAGTTASTAERHLGTRSD